MDIPSKKPAATSSRLPISLYLVEHARDAGRGPSLTVAVGEEGAHLDAARAEVERVAHVLGRRDAHRSKTVGRDWRARRSRRRRAPVLRVAFVVNTEGAARRRVGPRRSVARRRSRQPDRCCAWRAGREQCDETMPTKFGRRSAASRVRGGSKWSERAGSSLAAPVTLRGRSTGSPREPLEGPGSEWGRRPPSRRSRRRENRTHNEAAVGSWPW